jgi:hypothetical protein
MTWCLRGGSGFYGPRTKTRVGFAFIAYRETQQQFCADTFSKEECHIIFN